MRSQNKKIIFFSTIFPFQYDEGWRYISIYRPIYVYKRYVSEKFQIKEKLSRPLKFFNLIYLNIKTIFFFVNRRVEWGKNATLVWLQRIKENMNFEKRLSIDTERWATTVHYHQQLVLKWLNEIQIVFLPYSPLFSYIIKMYFSLILWTLLHISFI